MNKKIFILFFLMTVGSIGFSTEIIISDIAMYDVEGKKLDLLDSPSKLIYEKLNKHWFEGLIHFTYLPEKTYGIPYTVIDANKICTLENKELIVYGYIKQNENNWFIELKLYDNTKKCVIDEFYASDGIEQFDRLITVISNNILSGLENLTGINQDEIKNEKMRPLELRFPASLFYWTPIDAKWSKKLLGIAGINAGLEFYPPFPNLVVKEMLINFSGRFNISWDCAVNQKDIYPLFLNNISISIPTFAHIHFTTKHSFYLGIGFSYELELMSIKPKYEEKQLFYQNIFSFENIAGYEFTLNENVNLFSEITVDYHIANDSFISIKPTFGASFNLYKEQR